MSSNVAAEIAGVVFGIFGAGCFLGAFLPEFFHTYKTKNTVGINKFMFFLHLIVGILFFWGGVFLLSAGFVKGWNSGKFLTANGAIFTTLNLITSSTCLYTFLLKLRNLEEAKKMGITESEHYERVCVPFVKSKMAKSATTK